LWARDVGDRAARRCLFDPVRAPGRSLREFWPSPNGLLVALGVLQGSSEAGELVVVDVVTGQPVGAPALFTTMTRVSWLPDSSGFFFSGVAFEGPETCGAIYRWPLGPDGRPELVPVPMDAYPVVSVDGARVLVTAGIHRLRPMGYLERTTGEWVSLAADPDAHLDGVIVGDRLVAVTTVGADRGRIVEVDLDTVGDPGTWRELVPETEAALRAITVVGRRVVSSELVEGCGRLRVVDLETGEAVLVPAPAGGVIATSGASAPLIGVPTVRASTEHAEITFLTSGPATPPRAYRYDLAAGGLDVLDGDASELPEAMSETLVAVSADGTPVPCVLTFLAASDRSVPRPTLVLAYGGFNLPNTPRYQLGAAAFILSGGIVAHPMLRGGGEYGRAWWEAGRRRHKQHTFDDLFAVCEHLVERGTTTRHLLALQGGSNGGITAAVAAARRPDLFRAVVATAPLTDLLRHHLAARSAVTSVATLAEFGDPDDPSDAAILRTWSPVHNVEPADAPPAVLVAAAEDDVRTPPWHARKLVACLQQQRPTATALLRIWRNYGHGTGGGGTNERTAEWLGFVMSELGVVPGHR